MRLRILFLFFLILIIGCNIDVENQDQIQETLPQTAVKNKTTESKDELNLFNQSKSEQKIEKEKAEVFEEKEVIFTTDSCRKVNGWPTDFGRGKTCKDDEYDAGLMTGFISEHHCCVKIS